MSDRPCAPAVSSPRRDHAPLFLACAGAGVLTLAGCSADADIRPGDVRTYRTPRSATAAPRTAEASTPAASRIRYEVPPGWEDRGGSGLRLATLGIPAETGQHEVTVIPASGTLESNVARWAGQLDEKADEKNLAERAAAAIAAADTLDVDGTSATVVLLTAPGPEGSADQSGAILGAMIPVDESSALFVKYKGDAAVARRERDNFNRFVSSIRWK